MQLKARLFLVLAALVATAAQEIQAQDPPKETMTWVGAYFTLGTGDFTFREADFPVVAAGLRATFGRDALYQVELNLYEEINWFPVCILGGCGTPLPSSNLLTMSVLRGVSSAGRFYFVGAFAGVSIGMAWEDVAGEVVQPRRLAVGVTGNATALLRPLPFWAFGIIVRSSVTTAANFQGVGVMMTLGGKGPFKTR